MAEPGRRDEQSQDYAVSISSDTERGDSQQTRSKRRRSDGNFKQFYCIHSPIIILTCYIKLCMFGCGVCVYFTHGG